MIEEVRAACVDTHQPVPAATGEVMQCVYNSLTQDFHRRAVETLQSLTGKTYTSLNIVGGGSQDGYLNQQTANATGLTVFAGPTEGTALGNLMVQFIHSGDFADLAEARAAIRRSFEIKSISRSKRPFALHDRAGHARPYQYNKSIYREVPPC